jgi:hypothetical protein
MTEGSPASQAFAFLLGTGRCGSTLLQALLCRHEDTGFIASPEWLLPRPVVIPADLTRWNGPVYRSLPPVARRWWHPSEAYPLLDRAISPVLSSPVRDLGPQDATPWLAERTRRFFTDRAAAQGAPLFLHKFTGWPRAGFLGEVFPDARFIHVIRDGRAVANSMLQMPWWEGYQGPEKWSWGQLSAADQREWDESGRSFVTLAGIQWRVLIEAFDRAREGAVADRWLQVRYEDLLADPRSETERILAFLGLAWTPTFDGAFSEARFDPGRAAAYLRDLDLVDIERLDALLGPTLERLGYPASSQPRS